MIDTCGCKLFYKGPRVQYQGDVEDQYQGYGDFLWSRGDTIGPYGGKFEAGDQGIWNEEGPLQYGWCGNAPMYCMPIVKPSIS